MPDPVVRDVLYDEILSNVALDFVQTNANQFVAGRVFPEVPVGTPSGVYWEFPREYFLRDEVGPRPIGGVSRVVGLNATKGSYFVEEEGLAAMIDDRERVAAAPGFDLERRKSQLLISQHLIHRDRTWANAFFKTGVWGTDITGVSGTPSTNQVKQWNDPASDPVRDMFVRRNAMWESTGYKPLTLVLGVDVQLELLNHPDIIDRIKYTREALGLEDDNALLARALGVNEVIIAGSIYNSAAEGDTPSYGFIFNKKSALLVHAAEAPSLDMPSAGYVITWGGLLGNNAYNPVVAFRGREERAHSDWFEVRVAYSMKKISGELGVFFTSLVA